MLTAQQQSPNYLGLESHFTKSTINLNNTCDHKGTNNHIRQLSGIQQNLEAKIVYNQTLEVSVYPKKSFYGNLNNKNHESDLQGDEKRKRLNDREYSEWNYEETSITPKIRTRSRKQLFYPNYEEGNRLSVYYMMVKLLFPEVHGLPPLSIDIMDTIFYTSDGSMVYIYTDSKRGLIKTKSKNYPQIFFKRKSEIDSVPGNYEEPDRNKHLSQIYEQTYLKGYNYSALLRYKDESFIRLKQDEFKSIFTRPVQANERYKLANNAIYIQMIPDHINYTQNTIIPIQFNLSEEEKKPTFYKAIQLHCQETSFKFGLRPKMYPENERDHLLYIIYEIFGYINIHYRKRIKSGIFEFMKIHQKYYLSNVRKIVLDQSQEIRNQYAKSHVFNNQGSCNQVGLQKMWLDKLTAPQIQSKNQLTAQIEQMFDKENIKISTKVRTFIKDKLDQIQNKKDMEQSQRVFDSLNFQCKKDLHYFFDNKIIYEKFMKEKEEKFDRTSPLVSISNISWKKGLSSNINQTINSNNKSKNQFLKDRKINSLFSSQKIPRLLTSHKWCLKKKI